MAEITPHAARGLRLRLLMSLMTRVMKGLPDAFRFKPVQVQKAAISVFLKEQVPGISLSLFDKTYWLLTWPEWEEAIAVASKWLADQQYKLHRFDCENFAFLFSAFMALALGANSAATVRGEYYKTDGTKIGGHLWNGLMVKKKDKLELVWLEPQRDKNQIVIHSLGNKTFQIVNRVYEPTWFIAF
jgi:hypothetical protein